MEERKNIVTMQGKPMTLVGKEVKVGEEIPDCRLIDTSLNTVSLSTFKGSPFLLMTVPSLDTSVCSKEACTISKHIEKSMSEKIRCVTVSMDLPFAQKRWSEKEKVNNLQLFSDYHYRECGLRFGVLIKEVHLLARALFLIDDQGKIRYIQVVKEVTNEPNYEEILKALPQLK